jgi:hypothetical protein
MGAAAVVSLARYVDTRVRIRIVGPGRGALMATNSQGLRRMNELYALSKTCSAPNMHNANAPNVRVCAAPDPLIKSENRSSDLVYIADSTRAISTGRSFLLPGGRLVVPYEANAHDVERDGAVEVERIRIEPNELTEGWVEAALLRRVCCAMP